MKIGKVGLLAVFALGLFVVVILLLKLMWGWVIPDLFPGAVEQGLIAANISWFTALKVGLFAAILGGFAASKHTISQKNN